MLERKMLEIKRPDILQIFRENRYMDCPVGRHRANGIFSATVIISIGKSIKHIAVPQNFKAVLYTIVFNLGG
jgi:hypothetical protein